MGFVTLLDLFGKYGVWEIGRCDDDVILKLFLLRRNEKAKGNLFLLHQKPETKTACSFLVYTTACGINLICGEADCVPL